jgi:hypothetical protein
MLKGLRAHSGSSGHCSGQYIYSEYLPITPTSKYSASANLYTFFIGTLLMRTTLYTCLQYLDHGVSMLWHQGSADRFLAESNAFEGFTGLLCGICIFWRVA